jgi:predicted transcriptional regulator
MKNEDIVYSISVEDIQQVAMDELGRKLSTKEVVKIADQIGDYVNWYDAISYAISDSHVKKKNGASNKSISSANA